jgi:hypothetical protein
MSLKPALDPTHTAELSFSQLRLELELGCELGFRFRVRKPTLKAKHTAELSLSQLRLELELGFSVQG